MPVSATRRDEGATRRGGVYACRAHTSAAPTLVPRRAAAQIDMGRKPAVAARRRKQRSAEAAEALRELLGEPTEVGKVKKGRVWHGKAPASLQAALGLT